MPGIKVTDLSQRTSGQVTTTDLFYIVTAGSASYSITSLSFAAALRNNQSLPLKAPIDQGVSAYTTVNSLSSNWILNGGNTYAKNLSVGSKDNYDLYFITNNTVKATILNNGNVGIGTLTPGQKLTVSGGISSNNNLNIDGNIVGNSNLTISGIISGNNNLFVSNNLAVGTITPRHKLDVDGAAIFNSTLSAMGSNPNYFAGSVGIGTNNPNLKLTVVGSISADKVFVADDPTQQLELATKRYVDRISLPARYTTINRTFQPLRPIVPGSSTASPVWYTYLEPITGIDSKSRVLQISARVVYDRNPNEPTDSIKDFFGRIIINDDTTNGIVDINGANCHEDYSQTNFLLLQGTYNITAPVVSVKLQLTNPYNQNPVLNSNHFHSNIYTGNNIYYASRLDVIAF